MSEKPIQEKFNGENYPDCFWDRECEFCKYRDVCEWYQTYSKKIDADFRKIGIKKK